VSQIVTDAETAVEAADILHNFRQADLNGNLFAVAGPEVWRTSLLSTFKSKVGG
jgi:hypothetical protein